MCVACQGGDARGKGDPKAAETVQKINDCFFKALQHFSAVLRKDEHNIYAANGVAAVLAEEGHLMQAKEVLTSVSDCCASLAPATCQNFAIAVGRQLSMKRQSFLH